MRLGQLLDLIANPSETTIEILNATMDTRVFYGTIPRLLKVEPALLDCVISDIWLPDSTEFTTTVAVFLN